MVFKDRIEAGRQLAVLLKPLVEQDAIILGLPRGGVPVAYEIAKQLHKPLDVIIVRKLGVPWQPELAFGAIGEENQIYLNQSIIKEIGIAKEVQVEIESRESEEIKKRQLRFRGDQKPLNIINKCVIIVDDGIATGATVQVAIQVVRQRGAREIFVAAPVAARESVRQLSSQVSKCLILYIPEHFYAVGEWYEDFTTVTDEEVADILRKSRSGN